MKVALIQMDSGSNKKENIQKAENFVKTAIKNKSELVLLPEVFNYRGPLDDLSIINEIAEDIPGESLNGLIQIARENSIFILAGSVYEKIPESNKVYNTSVLINDKGEIQSFYRKINLFKAKINNKKINELDIFEEGGKLALSTINGFAIGLAICFDLRFPQLFQSYRKQDVHFFCLPSSFTKETGEAHWEVLLRARAIENQCYVLAPNQVGIDGNGVETYGNSMIINPWGDIINKGTGTGEEIVCADLRHEDIINAREKLPIFDHSLNN